MTREVASSTIGWYCRVKLFPGDRPLQVARHVEAADHVRVHLRRVDLDPGPAAVLGLGHRHVRVAQYHAGRALVRQRDADAGGQPDLPLGDLERRPGDDAGQPLGQLDDLLAAGRVLEQHRELIAAPAGDGLLGGHHFPQPTGRLGEHEIARAVPDEVIDLGEAVKVEEDHARLPVRRRLERLPRALLHVGAVRQPGQPVVEGEVGHLLAQSHLIGHVPEADQQPGGLAGQPVEQHRALDVPPAAVGRPHPAGEAAAAVDAVLAVGHPVAQSEDAVGRGGGQRLVLGQADHGRDRRPGRPDVLGMDELAEPLADQRLR